MGLEETKTLFAETRPMLFLGAGPSIAEGSPNWIHLSKRIADAFGIRESPVPKMPDLCDRLCHPPINQRARVEEFIDSQLVPLSPGHDIQRLLNLPWHSVFTTNYDLTTEAISTLVHPRRIAVEDDGLLTRPTDPLALPVYKMMGSCRKRFPDRGFMQLSGRDIRKGAIFRQAYSQEIREQLGHRDLLILGSSMEDEILTDIFEEAATEPGGTITRKIILVSPRKPEDQLWARLSSFGVVWIEGDTKRLAEFLSTQGIQEPSGHARKIQAASKTFLLPQRFEFQQPYAGTLIDALYEGEKFSSKADFYRRSGYSKLAFDQHWDFPREIAVRIATSATASEIQATTAHALDRIAQKVSLRDSFAVAMQGAPSSAKTMTAMRICHDWAVRGGLAVFVDGRQMMFSPETTADFIREIIAEVGETSSPPPKPLEVLVVLDNCTDRIENVRQFITILRRNRFPRVAVLATGYPGDVSEREWGRFDELWELPAHVSDSEMARFRQFLSTIHPDISSAHVESIILSAESRSFFSLLYNIIQDTQEPLEQSILRHFDTLEGWAQELVALAATFHAHRLPLIEGIASRRVGRSIQDIELAIREGQLRGVLVREDDGTFWTLRCPGHEIATILYKEKVERRGRRFSDVVYSALTAIPKDTTQIKFIQDVLIANVAKAPDRISRNEALRVMEKASKLIPTRPLIHHYGILVMKVQRDFPEAERILTEALYRHFEDEKPELIHHSFGELYFHWAKSKRFSDKTQARALIAKARVEYQKARLGRPGHSIHGLAKILLLEAGLEESPTLQRQKLLEALQTCDLGRAVMDAREQREYFLQTRREALQQLAETAFTAEEARRLASEHKTQLGYFYLIEREADGPLSSLTSSKIADLLRLADEGLSFNQSDAPLLWWKARLLYQLDPTATVQLRDTVSRLGSYLSSGMAALFRAKISASAGDWKDTQAELKNAQQAAADVMPSIDWEEENAIRLKEGVLTLPIEAGAGGAPNVVLPNGARYSAEGFEVGEKVALAVTYGTFAFARAR